MGHAFNGAYTGSNTDRIAMPVGGIGAGCFLFEGTGAMAGHSFRHKPQLDLRPNVFASIAVPGRPELARVLEGPVPDWKILDVQGASRGHHGRTYGLPRMTLQRFLARFPFGRLSLQHPDLPLEVEITAWSPFVPGRSAESSLPVAGIEYSFINTGEMPLELTFGLHVMSERSGQFIFCPETNANGYRPIDNGLCAYQDGSDAHPEHEASLHLSLDGGDTAVDAGWFRGKWFDPLTIAWDRIASGQLWDSPTPEGDTPVTGASVYRRVAVEPGRRQTVCSRWSWYVPHANPKDTACDPWYAARFDDGDALHRHWVSHYAGLRRDTQAYADCFFASNLPAEVLEAVSCNLAILKSPTVMRQQDGRLWAWEGSDPDVGSCPGSCTHVWNYAQAAAHLFPDLERSLRQTEFIDNQDARGHQGFRAALPIRPLTQDDHRFHAAADGQLGGIIKMYRDWRIKGDNTWLESLWPRVCSSLDYCIGTWDPRETGLLEEPHHNTYDIEFWGPDGMCSSIYLAALRAATEMAEALSDRASHRRYKQLAQRSREAIENELYNGDYYQQNPRWDGLRAKPPYIEMTEAWNVDYSPEALALARKEGPKYQYGSGCLADGVLGDWMARSAGLGPVLDSQRVRSHLLSVAKHNFRDDLIHHVNPQRAGYALNHDAGLLLCTWPRGGRPTLPFVYCSEVWTGIEYHVAGHLIMLDELETGLRLVQATRRRYDGRHRNPFDEYECGRFYGRALSSYGLLQAISGLRYDAQEQTLHLSGRAGRDFACFLATEQGFGLAGIRDGQPFFDVSLGEVPVQRFVVHESPADAKQPKAQPAATVRG